MIHKRVFILFALIAATHSYVLNDKQDFQPQLADERDYFVNIFNENQPQATYVEEDEQPNLDEEVFDSHPRQKRQDRGSVSTTVERNRQAGTNVNVEAQARLWQSQNRQSTLDANANYQRNFGGQFGTGRPNYGAGLTFRHRF
ncbi:uncharacterized protein LOC119077155 [Bradysia coprophila]|uniref:uncharacterized protein LOC119077155 n=1 Tax=Bradysia coprophila TaxID=38358 RepID=UPI00187DD783|nr:uncharacterized protein LOC119077155 [Bradysia coprophila]